MSLQHQLDELVATIKPILQQHGEMLQVLGVQPGADPVEAAKQLVERETAANLSLARLRAPGTDLGAARMLLDTAADYRKLQQCMLLTLNDLDRLDSLVNRDNDQAKETIWAGQDRLRNAARGVYD